VAVGLLPVKLRPRLNSGSLDPDTNDFVRTWLEYFGRDDTEEEFLDIARDRQQPMPA
jgi:hypothetical protein